MMHPIIRSTKAANKPDLWLDPFETLSRSDNVFGVLGSMMQAARFMPAVESYTEDDKQIWRVEVPGMNKDDLKIHVEQDALYITGERKEEKHEKGWSERSYGRFERVLALPDNVDAELLEAHMADGILQLSAPLRAEDDQDSGRRQIEIT